MMNAELTAPPLNPAKHHRMMATILLAWELGDGLGHFMNLRPLAEGLKGRGHRVVAVLRDLSVAREFLIDPAIEILQAPFKHARIRDIEPTCTFAQILHNCGFGDADELATLAEAWRKLYDFIRPDLVIFDHAPTALLASAGFPMRRALIGTGFFSPPDSGAPGLPNLRTWLEPNPAVLLEHESKVLANMNAALARWSAPPLESVAQLYRWLDEDFLMTFRELDAYARAAGAVYRGIWSAGMGEPPNWPPGRGRRIFAYLKSFPALPQLLATLNGLPNPSLVYCPGIDRRLREQFRNPTLRFTDAPVEMSQVARDCDLAILNGTHATTVAMLLSGKPALHIPIFLEQAINARAAERAGAAICASPTDPNQIVNGLRTLLTTDRCAETAKAFAARYADFNPQAELDRILNRAEQLALGAP
jgi:hypothetical protein